MIEVIKKVCFKCNTEKALNQFYKHKGMADGHLNKCKTCTKKDSKVVSEKLVSTPEGLEKERARHRDKYHRLNYLEKHKPSKDDKLKAVIKYRKKYPEKHRAKTISQKIKAKTKGNHMHHWSYKEVDAKDVTELSVKNHAKIHRFLIYNQKTFMYKDLNGNLLNTKKKHLEYINKVIQTF